MKTTDARRSVMTALLVLAVGFALSRTSAHSAPAGAHPPSGNTPAEALEDLCSWQSLSPASHVWYRIPPGDQKLLTIRLVSYPRYIDGMSFQVYAKPADSGTELAVSDLIGDSQKTKSRIMLQWLAEPLISDDYYVDVVNNNPFAVGYSLCHHTSEWGILTSWE